MAEWNASSSLPIADQFMRPEKRSSLLLSDGEEPSTHGLPHIPRKPVPSNSDEMPARVASNTSTVRIVSQKDRDAVQFARDSVIDDITSGASQLNLRDDQVDAHSRQAGTQATSAPSESQPVGRTSLDKPLPRLPVKAAESIGIASSGDHKTQPGSAQQSDPAKARDLERKLGVEGQINLDNTEDVDVHTHYAPAVTHETIRQDIHEIIEHQITREYHQDHIFHRILPVEEVEILPARHYVRRNNGELSEIQAPPSAKVAEKYVQKGIAKGLDKARPTENAPAGRRVFSAREFAGEEGNYKEKVNPDGSVQTESWWVHEPTVELGGMKTGQTVPFHLGSANPEDDGWRTAALQG